MLNRRNLFVERFILAKWISLMFGLAQVMIGLSKVQAEIIFGKRNVHKSSKALYNLLSSNNIDVFHRIATVLAKK